MLFNSGDKVRCLIHTSRYYKNQIDYMKEYTVREGGDTFINLVGIKGAFSVTRFKLIERFNGVTNEA